MHEKSDAQLLRDYARRGTETAFREIVERHADVIYSSALRQMTSPDLARDVAQSVFIDLARKASLLSKSLDENASLLGWLYRGTRFAALTHLRDERRRHARERHVMEQLTPASETVPDWEHIAPVLDEAMADLNDEDREALLLRFFKNQDFRTIGTSLGVSDDAAQKRVSRAVERLREFFSKHGVTIGASGLAVAISGNAVQAAPIGFALTISSALAGTTLASATTATAIKTVAMTTLQKSLITAVIVAAVSAGIYEAREASNLREQVKSLKQQQQSAPADQLQLLTSERDNATRQLADLREENERLNRNSAELIRLRGEVGRLRAISPVPGRIKNKLKVKDLSWRDWLDFKPLNLAQFPDSKTQIERASAKDVGISTPAALLQTWIWAQRINDGAAILKTWEFPEGTSEERKMEQVAEALRDGEFDQRNPEKVGHPELSKLRDLFTLGDGYYLALIEQEGFTTGKFISHQIFRKVGDEWRICVR